MQNTFNIYQQIVDARALNNRERTMAVFTRRKADRLIWQPRLHHWHEVNKARGSLPKKYKDWDILQIYDDIGASPRSYHYFNNVIRTVEGDGVRIELREDIEYVYSKYMTAEGDITQIEKKNLWGTNKMRIKYFLQTTDDFRILEHILRSQHFEFDEEEYRRNDSLLGDRCEPILNLPHGSIQRFFIDYMGLERGTIALWKTAEKVEELLRTFDENDDKRFELIKRTPFKIINFVDNIDDSLVSPTLLKRYMLPYYQRRTQELHQIGKYSTSHWDGKIKHVLPFAKETGLDGLECVTPTPQGNVTLEELKDGLEGMMLSDGVPATHFMPYTGEEELKKFVQKLLDLFAPNIIVGISDMMPPDGSIERVRTVGAIVEDYRI
jgi:hypothetical protein